MNLFMIVMYSYLAAMGIVFRGLRHGCGRLP